MGPVVLPYLIKQKRSSQMFMVDMHQHEGERYFILIDSQNPTRNRVEKVSDERFAEFIMKILNTDVPLSDLEEEYAA